MGFHLFHQGLEVHIVHVGFFFAVERKMILRKIFVLDQVLDFFKSRRTVIIFQLVFEYKKLIAEMVYRNDVAIDMVLHKGDIPMGVWWGFQLDVFEMSDRIKREKAKKAI